MKKLIRKIKKAIPQDIKNLKHKFVSIVSNLKYGDPSSKLKVIGITGTDGKTTTTHILYDILSEAKIKTGMISTIKAKIGNEEFDTGLHTTTPDPEVVPKYLRQILDAGCNTAILETTSHALYQGRVYAIKYFAGIYTNITKEHLDEHKTYERLVEHKGKLIKKVIPEGAVILNQDDKSYPLLLAIYNKLANKPKLYTYGKDGYLKLVSITPIDSGTHFDIEVEGTRHSLFTTLNGNYNVYNCCAAILYALHIGIDMVTISKGISKQKNLEGRWDVIYDKDFKVIVDFAHTPNGLEQVLTAAKTKTEGRLIVIFGCAAERDIFKRSVMGEIAGRLADVTYITSEDPRHEDPNKIASEVEKGLLKNPDKVNGIDYLIIVDREEAIKTAIANAKKSDMIIITGKGHEKSMNIKGIETPWSDKQVALKYLDS